jgi:hypothetical protein
VGINVDRSYLFTQLGIVHLARPPQSPCAEQIVMSETDDDYHDNGYPVVASLGGDDKDVPQNKKRKIQRACDVCRRKKVGRLLELSHPTPTRPTRRLFILLGSKTEAGARSLLGWVATLLRPPWKSRSDLRARVSLRGPALL